MDLKTVQNDNRNGVEGAFEISAEVLIKGKWVPWTPACMSEDDGKWEGECSLM